MSEFDERERAFERKFELEEELKFKVAVRAAYLFGHWVAEQMKLKSVEAETYARHMADEVIAKAGHERLIARAEKDLQAKNLALSRHRLEKEYDNWCRAAREQLAVSA